MNLTSLLLCASGLLLVVLAIPTSAPAAEGDRASLGVDGRVHITVAGEDLCTLSPSMATPQGRGSARIRPASYTPEGDTRRFALRLGRGGPTPAATTAPAPSVMGEATLAPRRGRADARWSFLCEADQEIGHLAVSADFPAAAVIGGSWRADGRGGTFPAKLDKQQLFRGQTSSIIIRAADGRRLTLTFPKPTSVLIQDNRRWSQSFIVRIGRQGSKLAQGERFELPITIATADGLQASIDRPVVIAAGEDWVPLQAELEIEPGSALDFSSCGFTDGPCGKHGWLIATPEGHFAFENDPSKAPRRFYGVNLCFDAQYLSHQQADQLCDRLVRLGYNTLRIHHYESKLTDGKPGFDWSAERVDQLDYLLAACRQRGIYVTTDLYVSRPVSAEQVGLTGEKWDYRFKVLVPVYEPAFKDWETFTRKLLDRVNPHAGLRWADDPTLAWLSMINEGNFGNYWNDVKKIPQWTSAWNRWLKQRYPDRAALATAWGNELKAGEDPAQDSVALPDNVYGETPRHRDCAVFLAETERDMFARMARFLRDDIKCRALLTNMNAWTNHVPNQVARGLYDYVDDHFYVDHPQFLEGEWRLPSRCDNVNPLKGGAKGGRGATCLRVYGKPFTISEYNYSGPGRFRGVGGILTGALAALQDWDVIWRFAYSHSQTDLFTLGRIDYFNLASDPLQQAADRAAVMLYLRGDLKPAPHRVAMLMGERELLNPSDSRVPTVPDGPQWLGWVTSLGTALVKEPLQGPPPALLAQNATGLPLGWGTKVPEGAVKAFGSDPAGLLAALKAGGTIPADNRTDPVRNIYQSETGQVLIDGPRGLLQFDTERTAGGYAEPGDSLSSPVAGVEVADFSIGATVFVTSVDGKPIRQSGRLLVTHLTDLQNTEARYADPNRQILVEWGKLPHLVRQGSATVRIAVESPSPGGWAVYVLAASGQRLSEVPAKVEAGKLVFTCNVRGEEGARMLYEVTRR